MITSGMNYSVLSDKLVHHRHKIFGVAMYQPFEVEAEGIKCMTLAEHTVASHKAICSNLGIFDNYAAGLDDFGGAIGGALQDESTRHLLSRFLNSAARTQVIACIDEVDCRDIAIEVLGLLSDGHIYIIDIAAGHGAGTMSLINTICKMREDEILVKDALDIEIHALDFSETSLKFYEELLESLSETYQKFGIYVTLVKHCIDITNDAQVKKEIEDIKSCVHTVPAKAIGEDPRYLLLCSAISGVKKSIFLSEFSKSYQAIAESFKENNSTFLWIEPLSCKDWMPKYWKEFYDQLQIVPDDDDITSKHVVKQSYDWIDPHLSKKVPTTAGDYFLMNLAKS